MQTEKDKAEKYVREQLRYQGGLSDHECKCGYYWEQDLSLQHWLRVLNQDGRSVVGDCYGGTEMQVTVENAEEVRYILNFNLTTGQPQLEEDYKNFNTIVGI